MKLSEKLLLLRQDVGLTQEEIAEHCCVSRQSVSKWESGLAVPDLQRLLQLSEIYRVSMDVLLRDEFAVSCIKEVDACGTSAIQSRRGLLYEGILIKESLEDDAIIDQLRVHKVELWRICGKPRYWTALHFTSDAHDLPAQFARVILDKPDPWFVDFKGNGVKYVIFRDKVLHYRIGSQEEKQQVCQACREMGIPDSQMNWDE